MSAVRMCDRCGTIFSEREDGWATFTGTRVARDQNTGAQRAVTDQQDTCAACTIGGSVVTPRLALGPGAGQDALDRLSRTQTQRDRDDILAEAQRLDQDR